MMDREHTPGHEDLLKKQALKEQEVHEVLGFLKRYGKLIGTGLLAAIIAVIASRGFANYKASNLAKAEQMLMSARTPQQLEEVVSKYGSTPTGPIALLNLAKLFFNSGDPAQARVQYERFLKKYNNHDLRPVAELGLAYCTEADGNFAGAAAQFSEFAKKHSTSYLHPIAILSVARCMEQAGQISDARIVLEDFLAENAGTSWASSAENALKQLTK
ncbi:MAG: tetratricopeptide repeat protein [Kiritimatiellaceae bacterium]|nr:tetratricopeptide repeat protein [Kiritimatiellaceae bacterium]